MLGSVTGQPHLPEGFEEFAPEDTGTILKNHFLLGKEQKRKGMAGNTTRQIGKRKNKGKQEVLTILGLAQEKHAGI